MLATLEVSVLHDNISSPGQYSKVALKLIGLLRYFL